MRFPAARTPCRAVIEKAWHMAPEASSDCYKTSRFLRLSKKNRGDAKIIISPFFSPWRATLPLHIFIVASLARFLATFRFHQPPSPTGIDWGSRANPFPPRGGATTRDQPSAAAARDPPLPGGIFCRPRGGGKMKHLSLEGLGGVAYTRFPPRGVAENWSGKTNRQSLRRPLRGDRSSAFPVLT